MDMEGEEELDCNEHSTLETINNKNKNNSNSNSSSSNIYTYKSYSELNPEISQSSSSSSSTTAIRRRKNLHFTKETELEEYDNSEFCNLTIPEQLCLLCMYDCGILKVHVSKKHYIPALYLAVIAELIIQGYIVILNAEKKWTFQFINVHYGTNHSPLHHTSIDNNSNNNNNNDNDNNNNNDDDDDKDEESFSDIINMLPHETEMQFFHRRLLHFYETKFKPVAVNGDNLLEFVEFVCFKFRGQIIHNIEGYVTILLSKSGVVQYRHSKWMGTIRAPILKKHVKSSLKDYVINMLTYYATPNEKLIDRRGFALLLCLTICKQVLQKDIIKKAFRNKRGNSIQMDWMERARTIVENGSVDHPDDLFYLVFSQFKG
jgi:hypothetical protein